jgi:hypothetical protein
MIHIDLKLVLAAVLLFLGVAAMGENAEAETLVGIDIESRVILGISTDAAALNSMLPKGWTAIAFPNGPLKGANLLVSFIDGHVALDADSNLQSPGSRRAVSLVSLAKQENGDIVRLYLTAVYAAAYEDDPYGLKSAADISRSYSLSGPAGEGRLSRDTWKVAPETGGELELSLDFTTGKRGWSPSESKVYSAGNPDFLAVYRWDSITDVVMSAALGKPMNGSFSLTNTIPELAPFFDGNEGIIAILDIPVRVRSTFYP